jgi:hypothetical protein
MIIRILVVLTKVFHIRLQLPLAALNKTQDMIVTSGQRCTDILMVTEKLTMTTLKRILEGVVVVAMLLNLIAQGTMKLSQLSIRLRSLIIQDASVILCQAVGDIFGSSLDISQCGFNQSGMLPLLIGQGGTGLSQIIGMGLYLFTKVSFELAKPLSCSVSGLVVVLHQICYLA